MLAGELLRDLFDFLLLGAVQLRRRVRRPGDSGNKSHDRDQQAGRAEAVVKFREHRTLPVISAF
jgi:hypothetical protein